MRFRTLLGTLPLLLVTATALADEPQPAPPAAPPKDAPAGPAETSPPPAEAPKADDKKPPEPIEVRVIGQNDDALQKIPGSSTLVGAKEIRRAQPASSGEILRRVPGLHVRPEEGLGLRLNLGMRGLDPTRSSHVLILEDGIPVAINPYGEPDLYYSTPIERIRAVEVVKGSGSILFGPQTIGGVVNFQTLAPPDKPEWLLEGVYGQRNYSKLQGNYGGSFGDARYVLQLVHKQGDGFRGIPFATTDFLGKVAFPTSARGEATVKLGIYNEYSHSTYVGLTRSMYEQDPRRPTIAPYDRFDVQRYDASITHQYQLGAATTLRTFVYGYITNRVWRRQNFDRSELPGVAYQRILGDRSTPEGAVYFRDTNTIRNRHYEVMGIEPRLEHRFATGTVRHTITAGARAHVETALRLQFLGQYPTSNAGDLQSDEYYRTYAGALYVQDRIAFRDNLLVTPGVRFEYLTSLRQSRRLDGPPRDVWIRGTSDTFAPLPGIGIVYGSPRLHAFGGVHVGFAPPRVSQAISPQGKDAQLEAENSTNYELGLRSAYPKWLRAEAVGYVMHFKNQIVSGADASGQTTELVNGGQTLHRGVEASASLAIGQALGLRTNIDLTARYTYSRATFLGGYFAGNRLPYAPLHTASATLDVEHPIGISGEIAWTYTSDQFADAKNTVAVDPSGRLGLVPAYQFIDLALRYQHPKTGLGGYVTVKNALDQVFVISRLPDGIQTGGFRQVNVGLRWDHR